MKRVEGILTVPALFVRAASCTLLLLLAASPAHAHAFGIRYDLPLPLWLYLAAAGAAVALSFVVMAVAVRDRKATLEQFHFDLLSVPLLRWLGSPALLNPIRFFSLAIFLLLILAGFFGNSDPFKNIAPTFVWVVWWVGLAFVSSLIGNLWDLINPWKICYLSVAIFFRKPVRFRPYPGGLGRWPAVIFLLIFVWMELISEQAEQPRNLAVLITLYSAWSWAGMYSFGPQTWLKKGDVFTAVFSVLARFAPFHGHNRQLLLRPPAIGLLTERPVSMSGVCFVLLLLTSVTFDGILETPLWADFLTWIAESQFLRPFLISLQGAGVNLIVALKTLALLVLPLLFIGVFWCAGLAIARAGGDTVSTIDVVGSFVLSVIPIAIAYHLSHYLSYLLIAGQNLIPLLSDPFGWGWNLLGTAGYAVDIGIINAKMIWYVSVTAIVSGHVLAVYIAHIMALRLFKDRGHALRSQIPMLFLMVGYTMISLWILSQPIIN